MVLQGGQQSPGRHGEVDEAALREELEQDLQHLLELRRQLRELGVSDSELDFNIDVSTATCIRRSRLARALQDDFLCTDAATQKLANSHDCA